MAQFATLFRDQLPQAVADEFDNLYTRLQGFLGVSFNGDGTLISPTTTQVLPVGAITPYAGSSITDANYLICNGQAVSRVTYVDLFTLIGATYGGGDGATTFNVPDLRGRFPLGKSTAGTGSTLGATGGNLDHSHSVSGLTVPATAVAVTGTTSSDGSHSHSGTTDSSGSHSHTVSGTTDQGNNVTDATAVGGNTSSDSAHTHVVSGSTSTDGAHTHTFTTGSAGAHSHTTTATGLTSATTTGAGTSGTANPPFMALNYIIRAKL